MVMNEATDIAFYSVDPQLRAHLYRRMEILENSAGQRVRERGGRERMHFSYYCRKRRKT